MAATNIYLTFDGNCREAFEFYKSIIGGEFEFSGTFEEMPPQDGMPPMSEEMKKRIMHISLPLSQGTRLMGSDNFPGMSPPLKRGNDYSIMLSAGSKHEADRFFSGLSQGGEVEMEMQDTFWGSYFGSLCDKYGIRWMISFSQEN